MKTDLKLRETLENFEFSCYFEQKMRKGTVYDKNRNYRTLRNGNLSFNLTSGAEEGWTIDPTPILQTASQSAVNQSHPR